MPNRLLHSSWHQQDGVLCRLWRICSNSWKPKVVLPRDPNWLPLGYRQVKQHVQRQLSQWGSLEEFHFEYF